MADWRVLGLSASGVLVLLAGLLALGLPDAYEGQVLYALDATHSVRTLDAVGLALLVVGSILVWGAGLLWQRRVKSR